MCKLVLEAHGGCGHNSEHRCTNPPTPLEELFGHKCTFAIQHLGSKFCGKCGKLRADEMEKEQIRMEMEKVKNWHRAEARAHTIEKEQKEVEKKSSPWDVVRQWLKPVPQSHENFLKNGSRSKIDGFRTIPCDECRVKAKDLKKKYDRKQKETKAKANNEKND